MHRTARNPTAAGRDENRVPKLAADLQAATVLVDKAAQPHPEDQRAQNQQECHAAEIVADGGHGRLPVDQAEVPADERAVQTGKRRKGGNLAGGLRSRPVPPSWPPPLNWPSRPSSAWQRPAKRSKRARDPGRQRTSRLGRAADRRGFTALFSLRGSPSGGRLSADHRIAAPFTSIPLIIILSSSTLGEISNAAARLIMSFCRKS